MIDESFIERFNSKLRRRLRDVREFGGICRAASAILDENAEAFRSAYGAGSYYRNSESSLHELTERTTIWIAQRFATITQSNQATVKSADAVADVKDSDQPKKTKTEKPDGRCKANNAKAKVAAGPKIKEPLYNLPNIHGEMNDVVADRLPFGYGSAAPPSVDVMCDSCHDDADVHGDGFSDECTFFYFCFHIVVWALLA